MKIATLLHSSIFILMLLHPPSSTLFPYTTLFRSPGESREILLAARAVGLKLRIHADELGASGGSQLAAELRVRSADRSEEHTSELQSRRDLVCRLLLEKKNNHRSSRRGSLRRTVS